MQMELLEKLDDGIQLVDEIQLVEMELEWLLAGGKLEKVSQDVHPDV